MVHIRSLKPRFAPMQPANPTPTDLIPPQEAGSLAGLLLARARRTPQALAYRQFDAERRQWTDMTWAQVTREAGRWRQALRDEGLARGERVAIMLRNCREWALFELGAQSLGLVTVPLYLNDRPENMAFVLDHAGARLLFLEGTEQWDALGNLRDRLGALRRVVSLAPVGVVPDPRLVGLDDWLPAHVGDLEVDNLDPDALATLVYTSGTTGRAKGVMLSHRNILWDIHAGLKSIDVFPEDRFLSFLPLSHTLERGAGFYLPMMTGSGVVFARSVAQLGEDLQQQRPTIIIAVPRIFERIHGRIQEGLRAAPGIKRALFRRAVTVGWRRFLHRQGRAPWRPGLLAWPLLDRLVGAKVRARLGGRLRFAVCGGAPLPPQVARLFIGLGVTIAQGYGLTETSPVISVNRLEDNVPESVGEPLAGLETRIGADQELLVRGPNVMLGYWRDPEATAQVLDPEGWLRTGDKARLERNHLYIIGRLKEIIVLANGEKMPPEDLEMAIAEDPLFAQVLVLGEGRPRLSALVVPDPDELASLLARLGLPPDTPDGDPRLKRALLDRIARQLHAFPGYAKIPHVLLARQPWSVENGFMTPTMKLRRTRILEHHAAEVERLYEEHP